MEDNLVHITVHGGLNGSQFSLGTCHLYLTPEAQCHDNLTISDVLRRQL
jgi:hypothetical protein